MHLKSLFDNWIVAGSGEQEATKYSLPKIALQSKILPIQFRKTNSHALGMHSDTTGNEKYNKVNGWREIKKQTYRGCPTPGCPEKKS